MRAAAILLTIIVTLGLANPMDDKGTTLGKRDPCSTCECRPFQGLKCAGAVDHCPGKQVCDCTNSAGCFCVQNAPYKKCNKGSDCTGKVSSIILSI